MQGPFNPSKGAHWRQMQTGYEFLCAKTLPQESDKYQIQQKEVNINNEKCKKILKL